MISIARLHAQLQVSAAQNLEAVLLPPFTCYFHPTETAVFANYAIPNQPINGHADEALAQLKEAFWQRQRTPRLEYLEPFAPALASILQANGFVQEMESYLMLCLPAWMQETAVSPSLTIRHLSPAEPVALKQAFVTIQGRAFGSDNQPAVTAAVAETFWHQFRGVGKFMAWWDGRPVAVGSLTQPHDGVAEVAGIATLSAYRQRGIGTAVTHYITRHAFTSGLDATFLTAGDERAGRVYTRVGFRHIGAGLSYISPHNEPH